MAATEVSFATCNLYNLNRPGLRIYSDPDGWDQATYLKKVAFTGRKMADMRADVWGFQELWHAGSLHDVLAEAGMTATHTPLVPAGHQGGRIVCGAVVRTDILDGAPEWITDFPAGLKLDSGGDDDQTSDIAVAIDRFSRPVLHFAIRPKASGAAIHVYVAHLKSKAPTRIFREGWYRDETQLYKPHTDAIGAAISTIRRTAEAAALRVILNERMKDTDTPVVVLGDLNDGQHSNTLNILTGQPTYLFGDRKGGGDTALYTCGQMQQYRSLRNVYYTHIHQNTRESLDHILVSREFYDHSSNREWAFQGMEIANDHLNHDDHKESGTTDHGIVRAVFKASRA